MATSKSAKTLPRKDKVRIEIDLLARHSELKRKLDAYKTKKFNEQLQKNLEVPKINPVSRRLASKSSHDLIFSPSRITRTHQILQNSRFMPKKVKLSLKSLKLIRVSPKKPSHTQRYDEVLTTPLNESPVTFPSLRLQKPNGPSTSLIDLPADISSRNDLLYSLRHETHSRNTDTKSQTSRLSFQERTEKWLKRKQERLKEEQERKKDTATRGCTFKPNLSTKRQSSKLSLRTPSVQSSYSVLNFKKAQRNSGSASRRSDRTVSLESSRIRGTSTNNSMMSSYTNICPVSLNVGYVSGYSSEIQKRAKPMIDYKKLNIKL